jgi:hypothetical protein
LIEDKDIESLIAEDFEKQRLKDEFAEKRSFPRRETKWSAQAECNGEIDTNALIANISRGGALLHTSLSLEESDIVDLEFYADDIDELASMSVHAQARYTRKNQGEITIAGLEFLEISSSDADLLEDFAEQ